MKNIRIAVCTNLLCLFLGLTVFSFAQTPQTAAEYFKSGSNHLDKKDYEKAIADFTEALRLDPKHAKAHLNRALAHSGMGNYNEGLADVNRAIKLNPRLAAAYYTRGVLNNARGNNDLAIADYNRAIKLDGRMGQAYFNRGTSYVRKNDHDRAIEDYSRAIALMPNDAMVYWARGSAYAVKHQYDRAIADLTKSISIAPSETRAYYKRAEVYCAQGKEELASRDKNKIVELGGTVDEGCEPSENSETPGPVTSSSRRFEDYSVVEKFKGSPAAAIINSRRARQFRTVIRRDAQAGPNFAGQYTIARWGCGSSCVGFAIVDVRTGRVHFHPQILQVMQVPYQVEEVLQFRPDSRLLIISGEVLPPGPDRAEPALVGKFYYEWKNNRFTLLETVGIRREEGAPR